MQLFGVLKSLPGIICLKNRQILVAFRDDTKTPLSTTLSGCLSCLPFWYLVLSPETQSSVSGFCYARNRVCDAVFLSSIRLRSFQPFSHFVVSYRSPRHCSQDVAKCRIFTIFEVVSRISSARSFSRIAVFSIARQQVKPFNLQTVAALTTIFAKSSSPGCKLCLSRCDNILWLSRGLVLCRFPGNFSRSNPNSNYLSQRYPLISSLRNTDPQRNLSFPGASWNRPPPPVLLELVCKSDWKFACSREFHTCRQVDTCTVT